MIDIKLKKRILNEMKMFLEVYWSDLFVYNLFDKAIDEYEENREEFIKKEIMKAYLFSNPQYDEISEEVMNDKAIVEILKDCFKYKLFMNSFEYTKRFLEFEKVITSLDDESLIKIRQELDMSGYISEDTLKQCGMNEDWLQFLNKIEGIVDKEYYKRFKVI